MKKLVLSITIVLGCALSSLHAQDAQFSQLENLPLLTNPATTGLFTNNDINLGAVYRNQWSSLSSSINSFALSFDLPPFRDRWGVGAYLKNTDEIGIINTFSFIVSGSYIISDPKNNKNYVLSAGLQLGFIYKRINIDNMTFDQQYEAGNFNPDIASGETFIRQNTMMPDANIGFYYRNTNSQKHFRPYGGFSVFHLTYPKEQFLDGVIDHLPLRYFFELGATYEINESTSIVPVVYYQKQREFQQVLINVLGYYNINDTPYKVIAGFGYRYQDAVIMHLGFQHGLNIFRFSYDFNVSDLKTYTKNRGAMEFSLIYRAGSNKKARINLL
jgi:type IX secretion system PorP/SprF family membrane protein